MADVNRACRDCGQPFTIGAAEQAYFARLAEGAARAWQLPVRCLDCRAARRRQREIGSVLETEGDEWLTCCECGQAFVFGGRDRAFFAQRGFCQPRRCRPCRRARADRVDQQP
jgi:hypothetical protein